ncbi:acetyl-CoA carboxylase biotin carboxyl carrier protein [Paenibacillus tyrfis]|uniref:acetyl-CoA carboxylase biotin carboxyl carrier protein n=1 Tax=Paenibacillus tyrfis TaxID=1501230 RepID=UPI0020A11974|nr:acetyl-CoA carboxylase biotin carboxyl carrier protein [Paenibacillus tyrfis]MCP1306251.1 acetyl-CoA carboxylase biotin carboxyl carrier protein [Paenibacillus tyrfis]
MFTKQELQDIIELIGRSPVQKFKYSDGTAKLLIVKDNAALSPKADKRNSKPAAEHAGAAGAKPSEPDGEHPAVAEKNAEADAPKLIEIVAPTIGTFYAAAEQGAAPYVQVGDKVTPEKVVCVLEAMKLFTEVSAKVSGEIVEIAVENGQFVEYGQPLFIVKPE